MKHAPSIVLSAIALILAFAVVPTVSAAQPAPSYTPVPSAKPDFSSMNFLMGTWTCTQMLRGAKRPDTSTTTMGMDGMWMVTQDTAPAFDKYRNYTIAGTTYTGYDPATKGLDGSSGTDVITKSSDTATSDASSTIDAQGKATSTTIACTKSA